MRAACDAAEMSVATYYRMQKPKQFELKFNRPILPHALTEDERTEVLALLQTERFMDLAPRQVYYTLLDEGVCLCSISTMYRILRENDQVRERRNQARHQKREKPTLVATAPNQVYTWDITKLRSTVKGTWFSLYVVIDIFSRCIVGWLAAGRECKTLAAQLLKDTCEKQGVTPNTLTIHADNGGPMVSKSVTELLLELGVIKSHSRPRVSNDNPYSESGFKTLKYCPQFPGEFGSLEEVKSFFREFADFYNRVHYHSGVAYLTPEIVHTGRSEEVLAKRQAIKDASFAANPARYCYIRPKVERLHKEVCINRIVQSESSEEANK